jgi:hypothetical protein
MTNEDMIIFAINKDEDGMSNNDDISEGVIASTSSNEQ